MSELDPKIAELDARLNRLVRSQIDFQTEVLRIRDEIANLRRAERIRPKSESGFVEPASPVREQPKPPPRIPSQQETPQWQYRGPEEKASAPSFGIGYSGAEQHQSQGTDAFTRFFAKYTESARADLEKFIGENLISKIGILILIIGVGIGVKYSIDNNLISPLARVILGYIFGFGLIGLAIKLKPKYHNFSAVLVSGGMAIMYFVTYFGYSLYSLIGQGSAFALMMMFTVFTVAAALVYSRQVIAHIGLVGAYAVPFLLSNDSGNYLALFTYITIINAGILAISVKKYWKSLFYTATAFTWVIFLVWFITKYSAPDHFYLALTFLAIFFGLFFATKIIHGIFHNEGESIESRVSSCVTGFIFYAFCLAISEAELTTLQFTQFFTYIGAISAAILLLSFRFFGKPIVYLAFVFVWLIYGAWFMNRYDAESHFTIAVVFSAVFFAIFYVLTLAYRLTDENFSLTEHAGMLLSNSFIFYGFGYSILDGHEALRHFLGPYTVAHAGLHLTTAFFVSKVRSSAEDVIQVLTILVLTFGTISIPVQFDGNFVTMIWAVEAALLFWFGRARGVRLFEYFSYPVTFLATCSLVRDWTTSYVLRTPYPSEFNLTPVANGDFVTAIVFIAAFAFIYLTNRDEKLEPAIDPDFVKPIGYGIAALGIFVLYNMFRIEIDNYFHLREVSLREAGAPSSSIADLDRLNAIWQINYTMLFLTSLGLLNLKRLRSKMLAIANTGLGVLCLMVFVTVAMVLFHELRLSYMLGAESINVAIRYISYLFASGLIYCLYRSSRDTLLTEQVPARVLSLAFEGFVYAFCFVVSSCELVNLMGQYGIPDATKLGLSILWGVYALMLIVVGIARDKKHLRVAAMVLLGVTLAKLFFYDITELETIPKTILFVTLGITLLVISFLYNKYKNLIFGVSLPQEPPSPETIFDEG